MEKNQYKQVCLERSAVYLIIRYTIIMVGVVMTMIDDDDDDMTTMTMTMTMLVLLVLVTTMRIKMRIERRWFLNNDTMAMRQFLSARF